MSETGSSPRKFKLRRLKLPPSQTSPQTSPSQEVIQQNLIPLKENIKKKKRAQQAYYENHNESGMSPLVRDSRRAPVHQRLGRRVPFNGTNTSAILPKIKLRRLGAFNNQQKRVRLFTAQQRLNRIRAQQREVLSFQNFTAPKRIKLRRTLPQRLGVPSNLQVQVKNNHAFVNMHQTPRRFKQILNQHLQQEIKKIQMAFVGSQIIAPIRVTPVATKLTIHNRFAHLS